MTIWFTWLYSQNYAVLSYSYSYIPVLGYPRRWFIYSHGYIPIWWDNSSFSPHFDAIWSPLKPLVQKNITACHSHMAREHLLAAKFWSWASTMVRNCLIWAELLPLLPRATRLQDQQQILPKALSRHLEKLDEGGSTCSKSKILKDVVASLSWRCKADSLPS